MKTTLIPVTDVVDYCNNENNRIITNIGKSVKLIDNDGIEIKDFVIPNGVTSIGDYAFNNCSGLTSVIISTDVTRIGQYAFNNCSSLTSVDIPNNTTIIGESAFEKCRNMETLKLPAKLQIIKKAAFKGCNSLKSVTIPSTVEFIYQEAFANCSSLDSVKTKPSTPPFLYDNSFSDFSIPLEVPKGCKEEYQNAQGWKNFTNISEETVEGKVKLNKIEAVIEKGEIVALKAKVYPATLKDQSVTWESSDPTIVKVTSTGKIKGLKVGKAVITCTSNATGQKATCKVTVVKASSAPSLDDVTGIEEKPALAEKFDVYDLNGRRVLDKATSLEGLSNGVYIVNGKKVIKQ